MYAITSTGADRWIPRPDIKTLNGAKAACTREFFAGYNHDVLKVGDMNENGITIVIAERVNHPDCKWRLV